MEFSWKFLNTWSFAEAEKWEHLTGYGCSFCVVSFVFDMDWISQGTKFVLFVYRRLVATRVVL